MTSPNSAASAKRDLHVGGVGSDPVVALATMSRSIPPKASDLAQGAFALIRENPWAAIGLVGLLGLTAGYFLSMNLSPETRDVDQ